MIDILRKILDRTPDKRGASQDKTYDIEKVRLATCALFLEMAQIDGEFSDSERDHVITSLKKTYGLSEAAVQELMEAAEEELKGSIDLWQFTNSINQSFPLERKLEVIEMIWQLVYADGYLEKHEDYLMHKLANLLRLSHKQLIAAKLKVKAQCKP